MFWKVMNILLQVQFNGVSEINSLPYKDYKHLFQE
jgi:hypothetical protein